MRFAPQELRPWLVSIICCLFAFLRFFLFGLVFLRFFLFGFVVLGFVLFGLVFFGFFFLVFKPVLLSDDSGNTAAAEEDKPVPATQRFQNTSIDTH